MITGIALYNCEKITALQAYNLAKEFFNFVSLEITDVGYYQFLKNGDHIGDHDFIETTLENLAHQIEIGNATAFRLSKKGIKQAWEASFGYMTNEFGSFHHIDAQFPSSRGSEEFRSFFIKLSIESCAPYGIVYSTNDVLNAFYYATGNNFVTIFPYENPLPWQQETPGLYQGASRYTHSMLRMVYPHNLLNSNHMNMKIDGINLKEWVTCGANRGSLKEIDNNLFLWTVESTSIDELNNLLGNSGLLISWQQQKNITKKNIP